MPTSEQVVFFSLIAESSGVKPYPHTSAVYAIATTAAVTCSFIEEIH